MSGIFAIDERDIGFVLFEHLKVQQLFGAPVFQGFSRDDAETILDAAHRFSKEQIAPTSAIGDREGCTFKDGAVHVPAALKDLYRQYSEGGWIALTAPEEMGGSNVPVTVSIGCAESMVSANVAFSTYPGLTRGVARILESFGDNWQREVVAKRLFCGEWAGTMCLTEPHAGTAVGDARSTATKSKSGDAYLLEGTKIFISGGEQDITDNIVHLVLARTAGAPKGIKGLSLFIVPKFRIHQDGSLGERNDVVCAGIEEKMGLHGSATCTMSFGDNDDCEAMRVGEEGRGIQLMFHLMNEARIGTGLHGLSAATVGYQAALAYAKERIQGVEMQNMRDVDAPRVPIIKHPDVKRMLFTMKAYVEGMRALLYVASYYAESARVHDDEQVRARHGKLFEILTPICKSYCTDVGFDVASMAVQVHGGAGYIGETGVEQLVRDARSAAIYEGANGIQALDLVGRKLAKNNGEYFMILMQEIGNTIDSTQEHPVAGELAQILAAERARVGEVVGTIAAAGMSGDFATPGLVASTFLTMLGNLVVGWLLVDQAVIADGALSKLLLSKGSTTPEARAELCTNNAEAAFFANKIHTAAFFVRNLLVHNRGLAAEALGGYRGILGADL